MSLLKIGVGTTFKIMIRNNTDIQMKNSKRNNIAVCENCKEELASTPTNYKEESVGCDKYLLWFHLK